MATAEDKELVIQRLLALKAQMPPAEQNLPIVMTMQGTLTIDDMIANIQAGTPLGDSIAEAEIKKIQELYGF